MSEKSGPLSAIGASIRRLFGKPVAPARQTFVIIGAGQAGQTVAETLRNEGFVGRIVLIGEEDSPPYQRPPLSKAYLLGTSDQSRLQFQTDDFYGAQNIETRWATRVLAINRAKRVVKLADGGSISYDKLALTTGSSARSFPSANGGGLAGVYILRNVAHVDAMGAEFQEGRKLIVIGGGYLGLEIAAVAVTKGLDVTVIEAAPRLLARVAASQTAAYFTDLHQRHGVKIMTGVGVGQLQGNQLVHNQHASEQLGKQLGDLPRVSQVILSDGTALPADFVIAGIGIAPNIELAHSCGLTIDNGICVNERCQTSDPHIVAAGDCASLPLCDCAGKAQRVRLESVQNAVNQAQMAAKTMLGQDINYSPVPWFWSDQYDVKLQIAGLSQGFDDVVVRAGKRAGAQSVWYFAGDQLIAVDAMNDAPAYMIGKRVLEQIKFTGQSPARDLIADPATNLRSLAPSR